MAISVDLVLLCILVTVFNTTYSASNSGNAETVNVQEQRKCLNNCEDISDSDHHAESTTPPKTFSESVSNASRMPQVVSDFIDIRSSNVFEAVLLFENILVQEKSKLFTPLSKKEHEFNSQRILQGTPRARKSCSDDISFVIAAARMRIQWALEMIDANGKPGYGTLRNTVHSLGDFDQCMGVNTGQDFEGRYCKTNIWIWKLRETSFSPPLRIALGLCFPSSCGGTDVEEFINEYFQSRDDITATAAQTHCQERHQELSTNARLVIRFCSIFATFLAIATAYDVFYKRWWLEKETKQHRITINTKLSSATSLKNNINSEHKRPDWGIENRKAYSQNGAALEQSHKSGVLDRILMPFSVYTNTANLFSTQDTGDDIGCIHGLRFFSQMAVILIHLIPFATLTLENLKTYLDDAYTRVMFMTILKADTGVDTYFAMSGLLMTYSVLKQVSRTAVTPKFFANFYVRRVWRAWPPCMLILMTYVPLIQYLGDGPFWPQDGFEKDGCKDSWWTTMLYLSNFANPYDWCMGWTWYLSCDLHFYIISPLMFLPLLYYGWKGLLSPILFLLANAICSGVISRANDLPAVKDLDHLLFGDSDSYIADYYIKPYTRIGPYIVGVVAGFFLFKSEKKARLPKSVVILGWTVATAIALVVVFGPHGHVQPGHLHSSDVRALYNALHRIAWGMSVCWVIFACANGYGGFVNTVLSWKALVPLGRLSFIAYLVNPVVIQFFYYTRRTLYHLDHIHLFSNFMAMTVLVYMVSYVAYIAYEVPLAGLGKLIEGQSKKKKE